MKIAVADEFPVVNEGLRRAFDARPDVEFVGYAGSEAETFEMLRHVHPDVMIVDLRFKKGAGSFVQKVAAANPSVKVLLYPGRIGEQDAVMALREGAAAIVLKRMPIRALMDSIDRVTGWPASAHHSDRPKFAAARLTRREEDIVRLVTAGLRNKEIAKRLGIAEGTVKVHLHAIFDKLGVGSRVELTLYGNEAGLTAPAVALRIQAAG